MYRHALFLLFFGVLLGVPAQAQYWTGSVKIGASFSNFNGNLAGGATNWDNVSGISAGGSFGYELDSGLALMAELLFMRLGASAAVRYNDFPATLDSKISYLALPVLLQYKLKAGRHFSPRFFGGPAGLFKMDALVSVHDREIGGVLYEEDQSIENLDWGFMLGSGIDFDFADQTVTLEARYFAGRKDITKPTGELDGSALFNRTVVIMAGIMF